jgi:hypothetical protein
MVLGESFALCFCIIRKIPCRALSALLLEEDDGSDESANQPTFHSRHKPLLMTVDSAQSYCDHTTSTKLFYSKCSLFTERAIFIMAF